MIVITCASGKQASSFIPLLISNKFEPLRLVVNSSTSADRLKSQYPSIEVVRADLSKPDDCKMIVEGATTIYHVNPSFHHAEVEIGKHMVDAAVAESENGNLKHFIFSSVIQTQLRKLLNHDVKRYVEEYLMESGLDYTILKPTTFFDNFKPALTGLVKDADSGKQTLTFTAPWDASVLFSEIALKDFGEASYKVIAEGQKHYFASYDLASTMPEPWRRKVDVLAEELGVNIDVQTGNLHEVVPRFMKALLGDDQPHRATTDTAERMILYYNRHGIVGNPNVLEMLLGRKATSTEEWVKAQVAQCRRSSQ